MQVYTQATKGRHTWASSSLAFLPGCMYLHQKNITSSAFNYKKSIIGCPGCLPTLKSVIFYTTSCFIIRSILVTLLPTMSIA